MNILYRLSVQACLALTTIASPAADLFDSGHCQSVLRSEEYKAVPFSCRAPSLPRCGQDYAPAALAAMKRRENGACHAPLMDYLATVTSRPRTLETMRGIAADVVDVDGTKLMSRKDWVGASESQRRSIEEAYVLLVAYKFYDTLKERIQGGLRSAPVTKLPPGSDDELTLVYLTEGEHPDPRTGEVRITVKETSRGPRITEIRYAQVEILELTKSAIRNELRRGFRNGGFDKITDALTESLERRARQPFSMN